MYYTTRFPKVNRFLSIFQLFFTLFSYIQLLLTHIFQAQMLVCSSGDAAASRRSGQESTLKQEGLVNVLQRHRLLVDGGRQRIETNGAAVIEVYDAAEHPPVQRVKAKLVHLQSGEGLIRDSGAYHPIGPDLGKVPPPAQEPVCNSRRAS